MTPSAWRPTRPPGLDESLGELRSELARAGFSVTGELDLPSVGRDPGRSSREVVFGPSVRLDVTDDRRGARTALRLYAVPGWSGALPETTVVLTEWWDVDDTGLGVVGYGDHLRATTDGLEPSDFDAPSNAEVEAFVDLVAASPFAAVLDGSGATLRAALLRLVPPEVHHGSVALGRVLALDDDVARVTLAYASSVLSDLAAGAPVEWALRRAEEERS